MSELIVAKAGGTSNRDAESVMQSMQWAESADIFVVSAPGKTNDEGPAADKVTNLLLMTRDSYTDTGRIPTVLTEAITERFSAIAGGIGALSLPRNWIDKIPTRVEEAVRQSEDAASMLGERLQAEIYEASGFTLLDPARAPFDISNDRNLWESWLSRVFEPGKKYVLPGNTTKVNGHMATFSRGGSDTSGGLAAFGISASLNLNLTDDSALSADPRLIIPASRLSRINHLLYEEGRELGRNGTGLVHPEAMVPLMMGDIPTEIRSTFDGGASPTLLDRDFDRAIGRIGRVAALSLMENVSMLRIHEPGMAEAIGRLAGFEEALKRHRIPVVDSKGDGVDSQVYFVETDKVEDAHEALGTATFGDIEISESLSFVTLVGYRLRERQLDIISALSSVISPEVWQSEGHDLSNGRHSLRISLKPEEAPDILDKMHRVFIEDAPAPAE